MNYFHYIASMIKVNNLKVNDSFQCYYNDRIHKGKVVMKRKGYTFCEITDPFNWRFGKTLLKLKD